MPLALEWLVPEEEIDRPLALVFIVLPSGDTGLLGCPGTGREWLPHIGQELRWTLIEADLRVFWIIGTGVDIEHILHVPAELRVLPGWDAPLLLEMGRQTVFLRMRRTSS
jgi:hypothetical protein